MDPHPAAPPGSAPKADDEPLLASARRALGIEARAVEALAPRLGPEFAQLRSLARHQLVYRALGERMGREIHALSIEALTPEESGQR